MDEWAVGRIWDENADTWTELSRQGYDICRDLFNTPTFLSILPEVRGLRGLDVGCGEGHNTRLLAEREALMQACDISPRFIFHAKQAEMERPLGIKYTVASATALPYPQSSFEFITSFMCLMDIPNPAKALDEVYRVLVPGGFLQFSITHPVSDLATRKAIHDENGTKIGLLISDYFNQEWGRVEQWLFMKISPEQKSRFRPFRVPYFHHTLSEWVNMIARAGFVMEEMAEPVADDETISREPCLADTRQYPHFLIMRCRKPTR